MKLFYTLILAVASLLVNTGCRNNHGVPAIAGNDTSELISILLDSAFSRNNLTNLQFPKQNDPFADTVIFSYDSMLINYYPPDFNGGKYKFLQEEQICSIARHFCKDTIHFPYFLTIASFGLYNSVYHISIQTTWVRPLTYEVPLYYKGRKIAKLRTRFCITDKPLEKHMLHAYAEGDCFFGQPPGGGMSMSFIKKNHSLYPKIDERW